MSGWSRLERAGQRQHGFVRTRQAVEAGLAPTTLRRAADTRSWARPHRGVVGLPGQPSGSVQRLAAAVVAVEPPVLVTGWSAAWLWDLVSSPPSAIELLVAHGRRAPRLDGVAVHRTRVLRPADATELRDLPVTSAARTVASIASRTLVPTLRGYLIDLRQRGQLTLPELATLVDRLGPAPGTAKLRRLLFELDEQRCDSVLEYGLRRRLRGLVPRPEPGPVDVACPQQTLEVDIPWSEWLVGVETDGMAFHSERRALERDARRHNQLTLSPWTILRATWAELEDEDAFQQLLAQLRFALRRAGAGV